MRHLLSGTGVTPTGGVENLRRLGQDPAGIQGIVCGHGCLGHATGLSGLPSA